jgi:hypothetical protein
VSARVCATCGGDRVVQTDTTDPQDAVDVDCPDCELGAPCDGCGCDVRLDEVCAACGPDWDDPSVSAARCLRRREERAEYEADRRDGMSPDERAGR